LFNYAADASAIGSAELIICRIVENLCFPLDFFAGTGGCRIYRVVSSTRNDRPNWHFGLLIEILFIGIFGESGGQV